MSHPFWSQHHHFHNLFTSQANNEMSCMNAQGIIFQGRRFFLCLCQLALALSVCGHRVYSMLEMFFFNKECVWSLRCNNVVGSVLQISLLLSGVFWAVGARLHLIYTQSMVCTRQPPWIAYLVWSNDSESIWTATCTERWSWIKKARKGSKKTEMSHSKSWGVP